MRKHPTVSAWQREHDGSYHTEMHGWKLRVVWRPPSPGKRRGFSWTAGSALRLSVAAPDVHEEIEEAMLEAEEFAESAHLSLPAAAP
jgi:hypothetical protein